VRAVSSAANRSAHALKGAAGNVSAAAVVESASELEQMGHRGGIVPEVADQAFARLQRDCELLLSALEASQTEKK